MGALRCCNLYPEAESYLMSCYELQDAQISPQGASRATSFTLLGAKWAKIGSGRKSMRCGSEIRQHGVWAPFTHLRQCYDCYATNKEQHRSLSPPSTPFKSQPHRHALSSISVRAGSSMRGTAHASCFRPRTSDCAARMMYPAQ